jgi:hypothetical protein
MLDSEVMLLVFFRTSSVAVVDTSRDPIRNMLDFVSIVAGKFCDF